MATETVQQLLSPEFLAQLERLTLASRRVFRGRVKGERRSPRKGHSVEFFDYRQYGVGDDLRYVDWNIAGRLDRLHVKLFLDEEDLCLHLLVDASASMGFGDKLRYTARLAAALGFVGLVNLERVGVGIVRDRMTEGWPPTRGRNQFLSLAHYLSGVRAGGATGLNEALGTYASRAREAGVAVVISDLMDPGGFEVGLRALLERRFDVHVVQVLAPEEENPAFAGDLQLVDSETGDTREITLDGEALRAYRHRLHAFFERVEGFCRAHEVAYRRVVTSTALEDFMLTELKGLVLG